MTKVEERHCGMIVRKEVPGLYGVSPHQDKGGMRRLSIGGERERLNRAPNRISALNTVHLGGAILRRALISLRAWDDPKPHKGKPDAKKDRGAAKQFVEFVRGKEFQNSVYFPPESFLKKQISHRE